MELSLIKKHLNGGLQLAFEPVSEQGQASGWLGSHGGLPYALIIILLYMGMAWEPSVWVQKLFEALTQRIRIKSCVDSYHT